MTKKRWLILGIFFILFTGLTVLWRWTPVANWLSVQALTTWASEFRRSASAPFWIIAAFVIAGQVFFPITVLSLATVFAFGPLFGAIYSLLGPLLAGLVTYTIGRILGEATICRLAGSSVEKIRQQVKAHGLATSITIHILPVAPFTLVNLFSGACGISARDFVLGTLIGQLPGVVSIILFQHQLTRAIKSPDPVNVTFVVAIIAAVTAGTLWLQRRVTRKNSKRDLVSLSAHVSRAQLQVGDSSELIRPIIELARKRGKPWHPICFLRGCRAPLSGKSRAMRGLVKPNTTKLAA